MFVNASNHGSYNDNIDLLSSCHGPKQLSSFCTPIPNTHSMDPDSFLLRKEAGKGKGISSGKRATLVYRQSKRCSTFLEVLLGNEEVLGKRLIIPNT